MTDARLQSGAIAVANAPVSYGAFEVTVGFDSDVPDGGQVLDAVRDAGYAGIDLGPVGYLGGEADLGSRLADRGLGLAGGYLEFPFADPEAMSAVLPDLDAMLDIFDAVQGHATGPRPRPTVADNGSETRRTHPGAGARNPSSGHDADGWGRFAEGLQQVVKRCRARGYEPTFHHETGTFVEAPTEIEKVLELSDVGLCLDTGHLLLGGGEAVSALSEWRDRINHVHIKDAELAVFEQIVAAEEPTTAIWSREAFPALGKGDLKAEEFIQLLQEIGYSGWLVVEQDILPRTAERFRQAARDQVANREFLSRCGL